MICCEPKYHYFVNEITTVIPYTGSRPIISVGYWQTDGSIQFEGVFVQMVITANSIVIEHMEASNGVVKILQ